MQPFCSYAKPAARTRLAYALPGYPALPKPKGWFRVGTVSWDETPLRTCPFSRGPCVCSLDFQAWYPAVAVGPKSPYDAKAGFFCRRRWLLTDSVLDAPLDPAQPRYPVVVFFPGWSGGRGENTALVQELASRGFVVISVGYGSTACSPGTGAFGAEKVNIDFSSEAAYERTLKVAAKRLNCMSRSGAAILDALHELDQSDLALRFTGRLDLERLVAVGHSFGGAVAVHLSQADARIKAAVNIDGWLFSAAPDEWIRQPFLYISDDVAPPSDAERHNNDPRWRYPAALTRQDMDRLSVVFSSGHGVMVKV